MMMKAHVMIQQQQETQHQVVEENMSNLTCASGEASGSSGTIRHENRSIYPQQYLVPSTSTQAQAQPVKRKRNQPGNPDPDAEVIALSPKTILTTNRFVCEICNKGFQRDQNLQLHRRGHNLPWKLKQRNGKEVRKKVYVCPEPSCVHHDPSRALGDLTGIKKHFFRKHGEKKWKCEKCSKRYAVQSDWKAHSKTCGTKEYRCDCGTLFSRRDSFITHRAFCDALAEESGRAITGNSNPLFTSQATTQSSHMNLHVQLQQHQFDSQSHDHHHHHLQAFSLKKEPHTFGYLRQEFPQWLAFPPPGVGTGPCPSPPPPQSPPLAQIDLGSSLFHPRYDQGYRDHQDHPDLQQQEQEAAAAHESRNPNPTLGPALPPCHPTMASPHISATALLQKAAQMGATMSCKTNSVTTTSAASEAAAPTMLHRPHQTHVSTVSTHNNTSGFSLNLSPHEELATGSFMASYRNKVAGGDSGGDGGGCRGGGGGAAATGPSSSNLLHDIMMTSFSASSGGFEVPTFDDAFGSFLNPKKDETLNLHHTLSRTSSHQFSTSDEAATSGGGNDGMTRDFLGLRPLSDSEIFNIVGLGNCMNTSSNDQHNLNQKPWQG